MLYKLVKYDYEINDMAWYKVSLYLEIVISLFNVIETKLYFPTQLVTHITLLSGDH